MALQLLRTANAGVLLTMDGVTVLLDGVCNEVKPYLATPEALRKQLEGEMPNILAFTHCHADHYDHAFATAYQEKTLRPVFGPESLPCGGNMQSATVKGLQITCIPTRHIGMVKEDHVSFVLEGSQCIWFVGDAAPTQWLRWTDVPKPDVIIAPYACVLSPSTWKATLELTNKVVLLHMPLRSNDPAGLWPAVDGMLSEAPGQTVIPEMGSVMDI